MEKELSRIASARHLLLHAARLMWHDRHADPWFHELLCADDLTVVKFAADRASSVGDIATESLLWEIHDDSTKLEAHAHALNAIASLAISDEGMRSRTIERLLVLAATPGSSRSAAAVAVSVFGADESIVRIVRNAAIEARNDFDRDLLDYALEALGEPALGDLPLRVAPRLVAKADHPKELTTCLAAAADAQARGVAAWWEYVVTVDWEASSDGAWPRAEARYEGLTIRSDADASALCRCAWGDQSPSDANPDLSRTILDASGDTVARARACMGLARSKQSDATDVLTSALNDHTIAHAAAAALCVCGSWEAVPLIEAAILREPRRWRRDDMKRIVVFLRNREAKRNKGKPHAD